MLIVQKRHRDRVEFPVKQITWWIRAGYGDHVNRWPGAIERRLVQAVRHMAACDAFDREPRARDDDARSGGSWSGRLDETALDRARGTIDVVAVARQGSTTVICLTGNSTDSMSSSARSAFPRSAA